MGLFDSLFGGGEEKAAKAQMKAATAARNQSRQDMQTYQKPFFDSGVKAMGAYTNALEPMGQYGAYYKGLVDNYQQSPGFQSKLNRYLDMSNNNAAAMGQLGGGRQQKELAQYFQGLQEEDYQNYLNNIYNARDTYLQGQNNLMGQGFNAGANLGSGLSGIEGNYGQQYGQAAGNKARARSDAISNYLNQGISMAADFYTGGMASAGKAAMGAARGGGGGGFNGQAGLNAMIQPYSSQYRTSWG